MLTTPTVMQGFQRYAQHLEPDGVTDDMFLYGRHPSEWFNMADHVLETFDDLKAIFQQEDYPRRMTPHSFGSHQFALELIEDATVDLDEATPFTGRGGVKLINWLYRAEGIDQQAHLDAWLDGRLVHLVEAAKSSGLVKRYTHSNQLPLDPDLFKGSLFEKGGVATYAGIEELWFESLDDLRAFVQSPEAREAVDKRQGVVDADRSFSIVMTERVVWDYSFMPRPAIQDPDSLEARIARQELAWIDNGGWTTVLPPSDTPY